MVKFPIKWRAGNVDLIQFGSYLPGSLWRTTSGSSALSLKNMQEEPYSDGKSDLVLLTIVCGLLDHMTMIILVLQKMDSENSFRIPKRLPSSSHLKIDGWKTIISFWGSFVAGAMFVSFREGK